MKAYGGCWTGVCYRLAFFCGAAIFGTVVRLAGFFNHGAIVGAYLHRMIGQFDADDSDR